MITSSVVKLKLQKPFDNSDVENALHAEGINPLRWAIVAVEDDVIVVSVSYD